jgi:transposase
MKFIAGQDRKQLPLFETTIDEAISQENEIRLIDLFVNTLSLKDFGFKVDFVENGRPGYHPLDLLKLYLYGYLNRIRSSRQLERQCIINIEVMWLMKGLVPDHNTISNFRRDNPKAIRKVFHATVSLAKNFELIGGKLLAGDGTKLRAQNSKKNNFTHSKIERHIAYIDDKLNEYNTILSSEDKDKISSEKVEEIETKINKHQQNKEKYKSFKEELEKTGEPQISTSDPESRQMITRNNITEVAYNVQSTVDSKHNIPLDFKVTNQNDSKAMGSMVRRAKTILGNSNFKAIFDKGYHTGSEFDYANKHSVEVLVAIPDVASHAPDISFDIQRFTYDKKADEFICPAQQKLQTNGRWYNKTNRKTIIRVKHYKSKACKSCEFFKRCTKNKDGRLIERSEYADLIDENKVRMIENQDLYRKRQAIVEHPFGIMKRQWDFYYIMTKRTIKRASADVGMIFTAYNLRRIFNIIDQNQLKEFLKELGLYFLDLASFFKSIRQTFFETNSNINLCNKYYKVA